MGSLKIELEDLDKYINKKTMVDLKYKIALSSNIKKCKGFSYSFKSFKDSDLIEIIEIREKKVCFL